MTKSQKAEASFLAPPFQTFAYDCVSEWFKFAWLFLSLLVLQGVY